MAKFAPCDCRRKGVGGGKGEDPLHESRHAGKCCGSQNARRSPGPRAGDMRKGGRARSVTRCVVDQ